MSTMDEDESEGEQLSEEFLSDEEYDENDLMEEEGNFVDSKDFLEPMPDTSKDFEILSQKDVVESQNEDISKISNLLCVPPPIARILLMFFEWNPERLTTLFFDKGKESVFKHAGVRDPEESKTQKEGTIECTTCFEEVDNKDATSLNCGHTFCNDCWTSYVTMKINEGMARDIKCMANKCNNKLDETLIPSLVDKKTLDRYNDSLVNSFVEDNPHLRWCPSVPHCGNAVKLSSGKEKTCEINCSCGTIFCFSCGNEGHTPSDCSMKHKWNLKLSDESENCNYIIANTKECPKCRKLIERNGGCNLMTCTCGQYFCWLCGAPTGFAHTWEKIDGHSCGKWKEKEDDIDKARNNMQRYIHYYDRYMGNEGIKKVRKDWETRVTKNDSTLGTLGFSSFVLKEGLERLLECRRLLSNSYIFAFYSFDPENKDPNRIAHKNLFEDHQEQLEIATEKLAKFLESSDLGEELVRNVLNYTRLNEKRCKGLVDIIENEILTR
eukprot:TRINITY_DN775_c0_g1_i1.p1 TRINITY_DN775_c0_g1~~TRINITY_DN775_c0_g1_i1.p1  ORF type:complete len:495 (-),score=110.06 TRINITY_DN775_c0_g1_i1:98-1582(-)